MLGARPEQAGLREPVRDRLHLCGQLRAVLVPLGGVLLLLGAVLLGEGAELGSELVPEDVLDRVGNDYQRVRDWSE
eukprot:13516081-Alexandrium_andersonii.AAC.1